MFDKLARNLCVSATFLLGIQIIIRQKKQVTVVFAGLNPKTLFLIFAFKNHKQTINQQNTQLQKFHTPVTSISMFLVKVKTLQC